MSERPKPALLYVLAGLILLESAALAVGTIYLVVEIFVAPTASLASAIALAVCAAIAAVLVLYVGRAAINARPWIRGATLCIAALQLLVAYSILITNAPAIGWVLVVPAVAMIVVLFTPPVLRATARPSRET